MLNLAAPADAAMPTDMPFRMGALFVGCCAAVPRVRATDRAAAAAAAEADFARPRLWASAGSVLFGNATHEVSQAKSALQQPTSQKYAHTTRIAAAGGGAVGPHSARDPV